MNEASVRAWSADVQEIGDRIAALTIGKAAELSDYLREVHKVEPAASGVVPVIEPPPLPLPPPPPERTVRLDGFDPSRKIGVIKVVREVTGLGLKEARDLVDASPRALRENLPASEAEALKLKLEEAGARVSLVA
jgi:large subunit ribosomal protein L7/L12